MRERLVGTRFGDRMLQMRRWWALRAVPLANPETASVVANAILADRLIAQLCAPGGTFLDVGAHIGSILASVHAADPEARILAIEAAPDKAARLREKFPYCTLHAVAVGETPGTAEFFINPEATGYNSLVPGKGGGGGTTISVEVAVLDELLAGEEIDLIKIDIEGAELGALKGAAALIARSHPTIMFESCGTGVNALGYSAELLWQWLDGAGYEVVTPDRLAHDSPALTQDAFLDAHYYPFRAQNFFAVHSDRRDEIRGKARQILGISAR